MVLVGGAASRSGLELAFIGVLLDIAVALATYSSSKIDSFNDSLWIEEVV